MFHKVKDVTPLPDFVIMVQFSEGTTKYYDIKKLFDKWPEFRALEADVDFKQITVDTGGFGVVWNDELDISCDELWDNGQVITTDFDNLMAFGDATTLWGLNESTLRKAVTYGKLVNGIDVCKYGKQWVISKKAMYREYGEPKNSL